LLFLGHVQVAAQLGVLGIFVGFLQYRLQIMDRRRAIVLIVLSVLTMILSDTAASYIVLAMLVAGVIYLAVSGDGKLLRLPAAAYVGAWIAGNGLLWLLLQVMNGNYAPFGVDLTLNGRMFVWEEALRLLEDSWLHGFGVYGVKIRVFWHEWSGAAGMNYAHNEMLQRLLDGGVLLLGAYAVMLLSYARRTDRLRDSRIESVAKLLLLSFVAIMLTESVTEYYYFFIFLSILAYLPELTASMGDKDINKGDTEHGTVDQTQIQI
jgi:O-antigen ligase